jgi:ADP-heptose:LPS heptosyltransferase
MALPLPGPILLVKLRGIGDSVLSLPSVEALSRLYPGRPLDVLVPPASAPVFSQDKRVRAVKVYDKARLTWRGYARLVAGLRSQGYGLAFCPHASFRTALLGRLSGAGVRSVRNHSGIDWFNNLPCDAVKEPKSVVEREFDGLRSLGWQGPPPPARLALGPAGKAWARAWWTRQPGLRGGLLLLAPGGSVASRRWPAERFAALAAGLIKARRRVGWVVAPGEPLAPPAGLKGRLRLAEPPDVQALGALAGMAGALLGNNSGPRHVAAASGARTFTLFADDLPREWHPYGAAQGHAYLRPPSGDLKDLGVEAVLKGALAWLKS